MNPAHYKRYWRLCEKERDLSKAAGELLCFHIQSWGFSNFEKTDSLTKVAKQMGFKVETIEDADTKLCGWELDEKKYPTFNSFVEEVRHISRGNFESELVQLAEVIRKYTIPPTFFERLRGIKRFNKRAQ